MFAFTAAMVYPIVKFVRNYSKIILRTETLLKPIMKRITAYKNRIFMSIATGLCLSLSLSALAQDQPPPQAIDQATREVDRHIREEVEDRLAPKIETPSIEEEKEPAPVSRGPKFFLRSIKLEGTESFPSEDFAPILERYKDREMSVDDLKIVSTAIEREYLRRGIIAGCFAPPQDIEDGIVTLRVVEAKFGKLRITKHGRFFDPRRINYYWDIKQGDVLRYDKMSKLIQTINKNPDRTADITLHAGELPGTTDVLMDVNTRFPVHIFGSFDREGAVSTGRDRTGLGGSLSPIFNQF
jgi:hemolysin activation/secretion protein